MASVSKKKKYEIPETGKDAKAALIWVVKAYVFMMLAIYPLYYQDKYYNMGQAKWEYFRTISPFFFIAAMAVFIWYFICFIVDGNVEDFFKKAWKNLTVTDWFMIAYLVICCVSTITTPYKDHVIWGYDGWYMGLVAQTGFVLIYFMISRYWNWDSGQLGVILISAFIIFALGVMMKFRVDPLEMYVNLDEKYVENFLSTLGQATWYSSHMCIFYPLGVVAYWCAKKTWQRVVFGIFTVVSFMTVVTQNSDSAYMAIFGIFFMLLWISLDSNEHFLRFLECMIMALGAFKFIGFLQGVYADRMVRLDNMSIFMSQSTLTMVMLIVAVILYVVMRFFVFKKTGFQISSIRFARWILLGLAVVGIVGGVIYIYLNSTGQLPENMRSEHGYLKFGNMWGNSRGLSWRCAVGTFFNEDVRGKLLGAGPDGFAQVVYSYFKDALDARWGAGTTLTCAHNEWLNSLINVGIIGFVVYLGCFITSFRDCMKNASKYPELYAVAVSIVAYILHNFFCYQQIICTPVIFILMGMAQALISRGKGEEESAGEA